jgi:hypothetical protein
MKSKLALYGLLWFCASVSGQASIPAPTASFTISASNITMPATGAGLISFTLTSVNGFAGAIRVTCTPPIPSAGVREPTCGGGPVSTPIMLTTNGTATGNVGLESYVYFPPEAAGTRDQSKPRRGTNWALAGTLMLGLMLRRRTGQRFKRLLLSVGLLFGLAGFSACSAGPVTLTPGIYTYTLSATEPNQTSPSATANVQVTVPPGIDVQPTPPPL